jgi:plasmid stabilization system protein ParE
VTSDRGSRRSVSIHPGAERELREATEYYRATSKGLAAAFAREVEAAIKQVTEYPEAAPLVSRTARRKLIRRFPYNVIYSVRTDSIRVLAIANQKRRPFYWRGRQ